MFMLIKEFARVATIEEWELQILEHEKGCTVVYQKNDFAEPVEICAQRGGVRYFGTVSSAVKALARAGFSGQVRFCIYPS